MVVFGPIPSRRLGHSLGVNHIPPKHCSYSCVYCQVGPTLVPEIERRAFLPVDDIVAEVTARVRQLRERGDGLDFLTFVPDGEPTPEGTGFGTSGDAERDLLSITAVHAMREDTVAALLKRDGADWTVVEDLIGRGEMGAVPYRGHLFYLRRFTRPPATG